MAVRWLMMDWVYRLLDLGFGRLRHANTDAAVIGPTCVRHVGSRA